MAKRKFDYFNYFSEVSDIICKAAEHLYNTLSDFDENALQKNLDTMHEFEHQADCIKHDMMQVLAHEFITPIEREDIVALAQQSDDVIDKIEDVLLRIYMFNIKEIKPYIIEFAKSIIGCAKKLNIVFGEFKNFKNSDTIRAGIVEVNKYESDGDKVLCDAIRHLSTSDTSDREFFVWTAILENLEDCLDACEDVADIIEEVIMKNT